MTVETPRGTTATGWEKNARELNRPPVASRVQVEPVEQGLRLSFSCQWSSGRYPADQYPEFQRTALAALGLVEQPLTFVPSTPAPK